jgi:chromosome partitioning protein
LQTAETAGDIPKAVRIKTGQVERRKWSIQDIPSIGEKFGQFKKPSETKVITFFTAKGGTLKTTTSFNFGRTLALHGLSVCLIGLDIQESLTIMSLPEQEVESLKDFETRKGLGDYFCDKLSSIDDCLYETDLPTLKVLPETYRLTDLNNWIFTQNKREEIFTDKLIPELKDKFDVIIFDCSPNWNELIKNALSCCDMVVSPASIKAGTYQCFNRSIDMIEAFYGDIKKEPNIVVLPTLKKNTVLAKQIAGALATDYAEEITKTEIREVVAGEEANIQGLTIFESAPKSSLSNDYFDIFQEIWARLNKQELS